MRDPKQSKKTESRQGSTPLNSAQLKLLKKLYTDPYGEASFTSPEKLWRAAVKHDTNIQRDQVAEYLKELRGYYLHAPAKKTFKKRKIVVATVNEILGIDLADFVRHKDANGNLRYMLLGVDLFSRKAYAQMMENKTCAATIKAFKQMFGKKIPYRSVFSDMGGEI